MSVTADASDLNQSISEAGSGFSVMLPIVTRAQGATTTFYTSLDLTNHTLTTATDVTFHYRGADGATNAQGTLTNLSPQENYHVDDLLQELARLGFLSQQYVSNGFGTLILNFTAASFTTGTEASAVTRIYNYMSGAAGPTIGLAYRASMLKPNGPHRLTSVIADTNNAGATGPIISTNLGLVNLGIDDTGQATTTPATITITFYDNRTGSPVGEKPVVTLAPGQVTQINDIFNRYSIPADVTSLTFLAESLTGPGTPQIDGYVVLKDVLSNDGAYFPMLALPPATPLANYDGTWNGTTNGGKVVQFVVAGNKVKSFKMEFTFGGGGSTCTTAITISYSTGYDITNGSVSFKFAPTGLTTDVTINFLSPSQVNGTFGQVNMTNFKCGPLTINGYMSGGTFTASK
jgi:hypothetical protein